MSGTSTSDVLLTIFSASSPLGAIVMGVLFYRQNNRAKKIENDRNELDIKKEKNQIQLDDATRSRLVQEAATVNEDREQRREEWWASQIGKLRKEVEAERDLSAQRFRRLNQLEIWATKHVIWDRKAWNKIEELGGQIEPPPDLPDEIRHTNGHNGG